MIYRELVEHCPDPKTYSMLGDAYISIQEPERAIEAYEQALKQNSTNKLHIASKLGKALVKTHQYTKAINYYRDAMKQDNFKGLKLDLVKLFMTMKQYDKAEATLVQELQGRYHFYVVRIHPIYFYTKSIQYFRWASRFECTKFRSTWPAFVVACKNAGESG